MSKNTTIDTNTPHHKKGIPISLTVAGSDSGGGAGIQADLKAFSANGVYGASVITALTAQNTKEVRGVLPIDTDFIAQQMDAVYQDIHINAVKIGMLGTVEITECVAESLQKYKAKNIVLDTVMVAKSGDRLLHKNAVKSLVEKMIPLAHIITPNIPEAADILNISESDVISDMERTAKTLYDLGGASVLLKGGHLSDTHSTDYFYDGAILHTVSSPRYNRNNTHGTGCSLSATICANLAKGADMVSAVEMAKSYISDAIQYADVMNVGQGCGPVNHFYKYWD